MKKRRMLAVALLGMMLMLSGCGMSKKVDQLDGMLKEYFDGGQETTDESVVENTETEESTEIEDENAKEAAEVAIEETREHAEGQTEYAPTTTDLSAILGTVNGNTYENSFFGIGCKLDDAWKFKSEEEIKALNHITKDMVGEEYKEIFDDLSFIQNLMASNENQVDSIIMTTERLEDAYSSISEETYAVTALSSIEGGIESMGLTVLDSKVYTASFLGEEHAMLDISCEANGMKLYQRGILMKKQGYIVCITLTKCDDNFDEWADCFYTLEGNADSETSSEVVGDEYTFMNDKLKVYISSGDYDVLTADNPTDSIALKRQGIDKEKADAYI